MLKPPPLSRLLLGCNPPSFSNCVMCSFAMTRNRIFYFLSWNVRGLNDPSKCTIVKNFIRNAKCCVVCLQEYKISPISSTKFHTICGFHLQDFRALDAARTNEGLLTAWNPFLFDCLQGWVGLFLSMLSSEESVMEMFSCYPTSIAPLVLL